MTNPPLPLAPEAVSALSAFLRGVERRAAVFAELQSGSADQGDRAVAAAMLGFRNAAAERPLPDWDLQFWRLLLATPQMRRPAAGAQWPGSLAVLAAQSSAKRAALLLQLISGLDEAQAAAALCIPPAVYARASVVAPSDRKAADHAALVEATQQCLRRIPAARLVRLAQSRERALHGAMLPRRERHVPPAWRRALVFGLVACVIAFAASFFFDGIGSYRRGARPHALPPSPPLETYDADFALMTHRDFEQLAAFDAPVDLENLDFYAWYAAQTVPATDAPANSLHMAQTMPAALDVAPGERRGAR